MLNKRPSFTTFTIIAAHCAAWLILILAPLYNKPGQSPGFHEGPPYELFLYSNIFLAGFFYLNAYFLIPRILLRNHWWWYGLVIILTIILITLAGRLMSDFLDIKSAALPVRNPFLFPFIISFALSVTYRFFADRLKEENLLKERETENLKTELFFLRSQISPHFMFNTLNSLVSLARKKSDQLEPILIKLSNLIRYMIYESETMVSLEKEIEYLHNYIELQKMRFGDKVEIIFNTQLSSGSYRIEPMILISFVENAFKHGVTMTVNPKIEIHLGVDNNELHFSVWNRYDNSSKKVKDTNSGIGIPNIKRRLKLLYGENHNLTLINNEDWFMATLKLKLK